MLISMLPKILLPKLAPRAPCCENEMQEQPSPTGSGVWQAVASATLYLLFLVIQQLSFPTHCEGGKVRFIPPSLREGEDVQGFSPIGAAWLCCLLTVIPVT